jgi:signal peptidase II
LSVRIRSILTILSVGTLVLFLDRFSKTWVLDNLELYESWPPIPALAPYFTFFHATNTGMSFGMFKGGGEILKIVAAVAVVAILIFGIRKGHSSWIVNMSLGLMLGGAAGNLYDRLAYGHVIDFLDFRVPDVFHFATFNVADSSLVVGTLILATYMLFEDRRESTENQSLPDQA